MKQIVSFIIRKIPRKYLQLFSRIPLKIIAFFYRGTGVQCNVCGKSFRRFLPYGRMNPRDNALCPNCLALERHRLMWLYLSEKTPFFENELKLLHIAPEACFIGRIRKLKNIQYTTADLESPLADVKMDIRRMPFPEGSFDAVFCNHVMEHIDDDKLAMSEVFRVLKPGGWAIIQSPQDMSLEKTYEDPSINTPSAREKAYGQSDHMRTYGRDYGQRLASAGFTVTEDDFVKKLPAETVKKLALPAEEIIYFCQKRSS